jgi:hypothetical protein
MIRDRWIRKRYRKQYYNRKVAPVPGVNFDLRRRACLGAVALTCLAATVGAGCGSDDRSDRSARRDETASGTASRPRSGPCVRPYSDDSPWNVPIGRKPSYDPRSETWIQTLEGELTSDPTQYTYPVYEVTDETPRVSVALSGWYSNVTDGGETLLNQRAGSAELPLPEGAEAAAGSDAQIILLDPQTGDEWGASNLERDGDGWKAWNAYHYNTAWSGVPPRDENDKPFFARGAGVPYLTGLVRPCEVKRGRIEHALAFAYDSPSDEYVYPATKSDGVGEPDDMPEGTRLQLDPTITPKQLRRWGCTRACLTMARALQKYGMYVIDNSGRPKVMLEYEGTAGWNGVVDEETVSPIPLSAFKVLVPESAP